MYPPSPAVSWLIVTAANYSLVFTLLRCVSGAAEP